MDWVEMMTNDSSARSSQSMDKDHITFYSCTKEIDTNKCGKELEIDLSLFECNHKDALSMSVCENRQKGDPSGFKGKYGIFNCEGCKYGRENENISNMEFPMFGQTPVEQTEKQQQQGTTEQQQKSLEIFVPIEVPDYNGGSVTSRNSRLPSIAIMLLFGNKLFI
ncbi:hypothetical protein niasHT_037643 [Heterodera trifolii]|uniref:Uncharacterized protein n=1 Tax=Heterodera trifolii TaxID=157864 RepID=A0ABD2IDT7_9BILA